MSCDPEFKKRFHYFFISKVYYLLNNTPEIFMYQRLKPALLGECDWENIKVNPFNEQTNVVSVTIHEALHWYYPDWSETKVLEIEKKIMHNMSKIQFKRLTGLILKVI